MVDVELPGRARRILYLFDPAGEHYTGATEVESLRYLDHSEALLFIVDPFALPHLRRTLTGDEREFIDHAAVSSEEDPADTLQRVLNDLRSRPDQGGRSGSPSSSPRPTCSSAPRSAAAWTATPTCASGSDGSASATPSAPSTRSPRRCGTSRPAWPPSRRTSRTCSAGTGLGPSGTSNGDAPLTDAPQEPPGTSRCAPLAGARARAARVPVGYQVGRWAVLSGCRR